MGDTANCELSLFGQVTVDRHEQILGILAGISAMQPQLHYQRRLLFAPIKANLEDNQQQAKKKTFKTSKMNQGPPMMVQLIKDLHVAEFGSPAPTSVESITSSPDWSIRTIATPEPETKDLAVRRVIDRPTTPENVIALLDPVQHRYVTDYTVECQRCVSRDLVLSLQRILVSATTPTAAPRQDLPALEDLKLLDPSAAFVLEACVRIDDRTKPALVQAATEQLKAVQTELRGVVTLRPPERLALDTRIL